MNIFVLNLSKTNNKVDTIKFSLTSDTNMHHYECSFNTNKNWTGGHSIMIELLLKVSDKVIMNQQSLSNVKDILTNDLQYQENDFEKLLTNKLFLKNDKEQEIKQEEQQEL